MEFNRIETYANEAEVLERIEELKLEGVPETRIHVIADESKDSTAFNNRTGIHYTDASGSFGEKLSSFFSGGSAEEKTLEQFNISDDLKEAYATDLKNGKILLYADSEYDSGSLTSEQTRQTPDGTMMDRTAPGTLEEGNNMQMDKNSSMREGDAIVDESALTGHAARSQPNTSHSGGDVSEAERRAFYDDSRSQPEATAESDRKADEKFKANDLNRDKIYAQEESVNGSGRRDMDDPYDKEVVRDNDTTDRTVNAQDRRPDSMDQEADQVERALEGNGGDRVETRRDTVKDEEIRMDDRDVAADRDVTADRNVAGAERDMTAADRERMELHEEKVDVDKRRRETGEVEVNKRTVSDHEEFDVPVTREEVTVERRPVNEVKRDGTKEGLKTGEVYDDGESIHVPVHEEEVEVNKKDVVKEEIVVNKKEVQENVHVDEEVRREEADISDTTENRRSRRDDDRLDR